jgi:cell shape-determining protein MreC
VNSRHTSRNKKIQRILILGAITLALLFAVPKVFSFAVSVVMSPAHSMQTWFTYSGGSLPQYLRDRSALINEMNDLKSSQAAQSGERFTVELLSAENNELRELLGDKEEKRIVAGIIGRPNKLPYDVLVLDKGSEDGIVENAPVFIGDSTVIGIVDKVFAKSSVVELITTPGFSVSVFIFGPNIYTNAEGIGGGQLRVGVPQGIKLSEGDLVILPSVASGVYGEISVVDSIPTRPEQYGYVSPKTPLSSLRLVSVGDSPLEPVTFEQAQAIVAETQSTVFEVPVPEGILITTNGSSTATSTASSTATSSILRP